MSAKEEYEKQLNREWGYRAAWLPGVPLRLGDIGTLEEGAVFVPRSTLSSLGISFDVVSDESASDYNYASAKSFELETKARGESSQTIRSVASAKAGVAYQFKGSGAVILSTDRCYEDRIADDLRLEKDLKKLDDAGRWPREYTIITHLVRADHCAVLISNSSVSRVEISIEADIAPGGVNLADAEAGVSISWAKDMHTAFVSKERLSPLFRLKGLTPWWKIWKRDWEMKVTFDRSEPIRLTPDSTIDEGGVDDDADILRQVLGSSDRRLEEVPLEAGAKSLIAG